MDPEHHPFEKEKSSPKTLGFWGFYVIFRGRTGVHVAQHAPKLPFREATKPILEVQRNWFIDQPEGLTNGMQMVDSFVGLHSLKN